MKICANGAQIFNIGCIPSCYGFPKLKHWAMAALEIF